MGGKIPITGEEIPRALDEKGFGSIYWLMEDNGSPKGKDVNTLTIQEAEKRPKS